MIFYLLRQLTVKKTELFTYNCMQENRLDIYLSQIIGLDVKMKSLFLKF
jgi:hypothetical protein